jgi:hypothetical protein
MYLVRHQGAKAADRGALISALAFVGALVMALTGVIPEAAFLFPCPCLSAAAIWWGRRDRPVLYPAGAGAGPLVLLDLHGTYSGPAL